MRSLAIAGRVIGRSLVAPMQIAGKTVWIGAILNTIFAVFAITASAGEKVLRLAVPTTGAPIMIELTLVQVVAGLAILLTFIAALVWGHVSLEHRVAPR